MPPRPPVQMGNNTIWWSEITGLNDPMNDSSTVLPDYTVDMITSNIREMTVEHRTYMLAELIPFVAAFLSELLRAVAAGIDQSQNEVVEVPVEEEEDAVLIQRPGLIRADESSEVTVLMQRHFDPAVPFGSRLAQLQAQLNGMSDGQSAQVAVHLQMLVGRLRRLAGELTKQHKDRFERLEALIATYVGECESAPLSLQVWGEHQLQALVPYLGEEQVEHRLLPTLLPGASGTRRVVRQALQMSSWSITPAVPLRTRMCRSIVSGERLRESGNRPLSKR